MSNTDGHFETKRSTEIYKHRLLQNYLKPFVTMTTHRSTSGRAWYIDAFAGPGAYDTETGDDATGSAGSPLIAIRTADGLRTAADPRDVRCVFIERDPIHAAVLEERVAHNVENGTATVIRGAAATHLGEAVASAGADPLLTFVDPFGEPLPKDLLMSSVFSRPAHAKNELLLNFSIVWLQRLAPVIAKRTRRTGQEEADIDSITQVFGTDSWLDEFLSVYSPHQEGTASAAALAVADTFRRSIADASGYDCTTVAVRRKVGHVPLFELSLFHRAGAALFKFECAASMANEAWREYLHLTDAARDEREHQGALLPAYGAQVLREQWAESEAALYEHITATVTANLRRLAARGAPVAVSTHVADVFETVRGLARERHLRAAWKRLATEGVLEPCPTGHLHHAVLTPRPSALLT